MRKLLILYIVLNSLSVGAQSENLQVESFYPISAFVANRLIPFTVSGGEGVKVTRVELQDADSCKSLIDPFYPHIFHIFCASPGLIDVAVTVEIEGDPFDYILTFNNMSVAERRVPSSELDSVTRPGEAD